MRMSSPGNITVAYDDDLNSNNGLDNNSRSCYCRNFCIYCIVTIRKILTFLISHLGLISMVTGYCLIGAFLFEYLESHNELQVKKSIGRMREAVRDDIWNITNYLDTLKEDIWIDLIEDRIKKFEKDITKSMRVKGWNGYEESNRNEWTFSGALFYSIVVVTTIGYGDQTPKTDAGKTVTIIYAILGIPLMLFCLTNTGDAMAHSFKFLYWRIFCYSCLTDKNKKRRTGYIRRQRMMRSRISTKSLYVSGSAGGAGSADSSSNGPSSMVSPPKLIRSMSVRTPRSFERPRRTVIDDFALATATGGGGGGGGVDDTVDDVITFDNLTKSIKISSTDNKETEILDEELLIQRTDDLRASKKSQSSEKSTKSLSLHLPTDKNRIGARTSLDPSNIGLSYGKSNFPSSKRLYTDPGVDHPSEYDYVDDQEDEANRSVPLWVCLVLVMGYVTGGAVLFSGWENWKLLDSFYFCFITLTTIGFGDFVPKTNNKLEPEMSIIFCSVYLLFGMSLLVMTFNLVQEQVVTKVRNIAYNLGIIDDEEMYDFQE